MKINRFSWASLLAFAVLGAAGSIAQQPNHPPQGFIALFNGVDLAGWGGAVTRDPREVAALTGETKAAWDAKMKQGIADHWRVENGELVNDGHDPFLATTAEFGDLEMWVDWQISPHGDSGVYLHGAPQVQIWDPSNPAELKNGADKGSGGLWNNQKHERFPTKVADKPIGEWNHMYIRMVGSYVTVVLNGEKVVDDVVLENYYDRAIPVFMRGPIYLQTHGAPIRFRNVFLREIPGEEADGILARIGGDSGFDSLFNGRDLSGWQGARDDYEVAGGAIQCKSGRSGNLVTDKEYGNFVARLEFRLPPGGNNGLAIRTPSAEAHASNEGLELQVLDDTADQYKVLHDYQYHGSIYGLVPAHRGYLRPVGEWNYEQATIDGDHVEVQLNGFTIVDANLAEARQHPADEQEHPGASRTSGYFGFCGHEDPVAFRNIRIKRLP